MTYAKQALAQSYHTEAMRQRAGVVADQERLLTGLGWNWPKTAVMGGLCPAVGYNYLIVIVYKLFIQHNTDTVQTSLELIISNFSFLYFIFNLYNIIPVFQFL